MATNTSDEIKDGAIQTVGSQDPEAPSAEVSGQKQSLSDKFTIVGLSSSIEFLRSGLPRIMLT
jgi:hypothetical protein